MHFVSVHMYKEDLRYNTSIFSMLFVFFSQSKAFICNNSIFAYLNLLYTFCLLYMEYQMLMKGKLEFDSQILCKFYANFM